MKNGPPSLPMIQEIPPHKRLFPSHDHPYYIVAPDYTHQSAGIKSLHLLCHCLNRLGHTAFMMRQTSNGTFPYRRMKLNPELATPLLTWADYRRHLSQGRTPIVVYPEIIGGNPLKAPIVVRYVLNFPGLLGGDKQYSPEEIVYAYSKTLAAAADVGEDRVLFIPASDTNLFHQGPETGRQGSCFYAGKYREVHNGELFPVTRNSVEIRRGAKGQPTAEVAELFRRSELFYTYENTALAIEAMLCGCPTVFLPNEHLTGIIAADELGNDGFAWGDSPEEVERARRTVGAGYQRYIGVYDAFWEQLNRFAEHTQEQARQRGARCEVPALNRPPPVQLLKSLRKLSIFRKARRVFALLAYIGLLVLAYRLGRG